MRNRESRILKKKEELLNLRIIENKETRQKKPEHTLKDSKSIEKI